MHNCILGGHGDKCVTFLKSTYCIGFHVHVRVHVQVIIIIIIYNNNNNNH